MASSATNISESGDLAHSGTIVLDDFSDTYRESESHAKYFIFLPSARDLKCAIIKTLCHFQGLWMSTTETDHSS